MMKTMRIVAGSLLAFALVIVLTITRTTGSAPAETAPPVPPRPAPPLRTTDPDVTNATVGTGAPAITPHLTPGPDAPAFTEEDVRAYLATAGLGPGRARASAPYQVEGMTCQTGSGLKARGAFTGRPAGTLLCLV